jgi:hypothetical protein
MQSILPAQVIEQLERLKILLEINCNLSPEIPLIGMEIMPWVKPMVPLLEDLCQELMVGFTIKTIKVMYPGDLECFLKANMMFPKDKFHHNLMLKITHNWGDDALIIPQDKQGCGRPSNLWVFNRVVTEPHRLTKYYVPHHWWIQWFGGKEVVEDMDIVSSNMQSTMEEGEEKEKKIMVEGWWKEDGQKSRKQRKRLDSGLDTLRMWYVADAILNAQINLLISALALLN